MPNPLYRQPIVKFGIIPAVSLMNTGISSGSRAPCVDQKAWIVAQVLIIDDQIHSIKMLSLAIKMLGHETLEAVGGEDAVELVNGSRPDIIFLDYMMPGMDGLKTLERLRSLPDMENLPIYFLTAAKDFYLEERARAAGARGFIQKPVNLEDLEGLLAP